MAWGLRIRGLLIVGLAAGGMLSSGTVEAQVTFGDFHANADGILQGLYDGSYGNLQSNTHTLGLAGRGEINGNYYNPNFLSFSVMPYYGRSQDNSDSASITDASGYNATAHLFTGTHFPGFVTANQTWNDSGAYGIPGLTGLNTENNSHSVGVGWSALLPGLPSLSVGYNDTAGNSQLLGSDSSTAQGTRNFNLGSTYTTAGYYFTGGFTHLNTDVNITDSLLTGESDTSDSSSNQYRLTMQGPIPYRRSSMNVNFSRASYDTHDSLEGQYSGTTDTVNGNLNFMFPKAPVNVNVVYTDNLLGTFEQQLINNGQVPVDFSNNTASHSISFGATSFLNVLPRLMLGGYVQRTEQFFEGQTYGVTQVGLNLSYSFLQKLKGLVVYGGVFDNADQQGNERLGLIGNATYSRSFGRWDIDSFARYDQYVQTLLANYTTSTLYYGGTVRRQINQDWRWMSVASFTRSVFEQTAGNGSHAESFTTMLVHKRGSISGIYTKSDGTTIFTSTGLVTTPVPPSLFGPANTILFSGSNYGGSFTVLPLRGLQISCAWTRSISNTTSPTLISNNGSTNAYGLLTYYWRKLLFQAGATKFNQSISSSGTPPSMLTSYSFGISRWFKGF